MQDVGVFICQQQSSRWYVISFYSKPQVPWHLYVFFHDFFSWNQWSNLPPDCDCHSLAEIRVLLHLWVGPIPHKIPKRTLQKLEGPRRILLSIITCIYDCWQWTSQGEEAIRLAVALHKKIEEKAVPVRTWLVCHL